VLSNVSTGEEARGKVANIKHWTRLREILEKKLFFVALPKKLFPMAPFLGISPTSFPHSNVCGAAFNSHMGEKRIEEINTGIWISLSERILLS